MGYSMIFETIFVRLSDGRLIHFDRSGCNNDDSGRSRDEFNGKIYTDNTLKERTSKFMENPEDKDSFELKILSKPCSYYNYGEHLIRMAKRAIPFDELLKQRTVYGIRYDGIELLDDNSTKLTGKEAEDYTYAYMYREKETPYRILRTYLESEQDIVEALDKYNQSVSFYIGKRRKLA